MKTLSGLGESIKDFNGEAIPNGAEDLTVGQALGIMLARATSDDPVRADEVARKVYYAEEELELEDGDVAMLRGAVKHDQFYGNLVKAAALRVVDPKGL